MTSRKSSNSRSVSPDVPFTMLKGLFILFGFFLLMFLCSAVVAQAINTTIPAGTRENLLASVAIQGILLFGVPAVATSVIVGGKNFPSMLGINRGFYFRSLLGAILIFALALPFLNQVILYNSEMHLPWPGVEQTLRDWEDAAQVQTEILLNTTTIGGLLSGILVVGVITGICEELFFRGTLQTLMTRAGVNGHLAVWTAALVFSLAHMQFYGFFPRLLLGAFFGYLFLWTQSVWLNAALHTINNSLVVFFTWITSRYDLSLNFDSFGTTSGFPWLPICSAAGVFLLVRYLHSWIFAPTRNKNIE